MATESTRTLTVRQAQSKADRQATLDLLRGKKRRTKDLTIKIEDEEVTLKFQAISAKELDALSTKYKPTMDQKMEGARFNPDTFPPALIAACSVQPVMTFEEAKEIWESPEWSNGELATLFTTCLDLCNAGLDIPFTENA